MGQLDHHSGRDDLRSARVAEVARQQGEQRTEPLPAGVDQVTRGNIKDLVIGANGSPQASLDLVQSGPNRTLQLGVLENDADGGRTHPGNTVCRCAALLARSRIGWGKRPSQMVTAAARVSAMVVSGDGIVIVGPFSGGSAKNISTMMRR